eukprot:289971_1
MSSEVVSANYTDDYYLCLGHHLQGFTSFSLLILYGFYHMYHSKKCNLSSGLHTILWIIYLCCQTCFCSLNVIMCENIANNLIISLSRAIIIYFAASCQCVLGLYIILSIKYNELYSQKKTIIMVISIYIITMTLFIIGIIIKSTIMRLIVASINAYMALIPLSLCFYHIYRHTYYKQKIFLFIFVISFIFAVIPVYNQNIPDLLPFGLPNGTAKVMYTICGELLWTIGLIEMDKVIKLFSHISHKQETEQYEQIQLAGKSKSDDNNNNNKEMDVLLSNEDK